MGYIYKITNDINSKIYIGQTINTIEYRFRCHINEANQQNHQNKFHNALREIGPEHFKIELIEECDNDELNDRECYWIKYYDSVNTGYNTTWGGSCGKHYNRETILQLWEQGLNIMKISEKLGIDRGLLATILYSLGIPKNEITKRHYEANRIQKKNRQISQIDINTGEIIKIWPMMSEIEKVLNINHSLIVACCKLKPQHKTAGGYAWRYAEDYNSNTDKETLLNFLSKNNKY